MEYIIQTYYILVLILYSRVMKNLAVLAVFNTTYRNEITVHVSTMVC